MGTIEGMLVSLPEYIENANNTKEIVLAQLLIDEVITQEQYDKYTQNYQVIIVKNNWFKTWVKKFNKEPEAYSLKFVKFE